MASGTSYEIDIDVQAGSVAPAAAAVETLAEKLAKAGEAQKQATKALSAGDRAYAQAEQVAMYSSKALDRATVKVEQQKAKIDKLMAEGDTKGQAKAEAALVKLMARQTELSAQSEKAAAALAVQATELDKLTAASEAADQKQAAIAQSIKDAEAAAKAEAAAVAEAAAEKAKAEELAAKAAEAAAEKQAKAAEAESLKKMAEDAKALEEASIAAAKALEEQAFKRGDFEDLADGAKKLGGPLGRIADVAGDTSEGLGKLASSVGVLGAATAVAVVAVVAIAAAIGAAAVAVLKWSVSMADANRNQKLLSAGIAGSVEGGVELEATVKRLERRLPQTSDELRTMAADLAKSGLRGQELSDALEDSATKAAELKWGPDFAKGAVSIDKLTTRLRANFSGLFGALNIDKLLEGLGSLVDLFDETSATGRAIKVVFESVFQPLIDGLASLAPAIVRGFIQFEIWVMKALIAVKPFGSTLLMLGKLIGVAMLAVAAVIGVVVANLLLTSAAAGVLVGGIVYLGAKLVELTMWFMDMASKGIVAVVNAFASLGKAVWDFLSQLSLVQMGTDLVTGLAQGITNAAGAVVSAITGVVDGAIGKAKSLLGIASPSKVFEALGQNTGEGMVQGVEGSTGAVQGSIESMVAPPDAPAAGATMPGGAAGGANLSGATFIFNGVQGAEDALSRFEEALTKVLEGDVSALGGEVPA